MKKLSIIIFILLMAYLSYGQTPEPNLNLVRPCFYTEATSGMEEWEIPDDICENITICLGDSFILEWVVYQNFVVFDSYDLDFYQSSIGTVEITTEEVQPDIFQAGYTPPIAGVFTFDILTPSGTAIGQEFTVTVIDTPQVNITQNQPLCLGETVTLDAGTGYETYLWSTGATTQTIDVTTPDTYSVTVTNIEGCEGIDEHVLEVVTPPTITADIGDICFGESNGYIDLTLTGGTPVFTYNWSNSSTNQDLTGLSQENDYTVTITDDGGCTYTETYHATELDEIIPTTNTTNISCNGYTDGSIDLSVTGGTAPYTYDWDNDGTGDNNDPQDLNNLATGTYHVTITDDNGCTATASATITEPSILSSSLNSTNNLCYGDANGSIDLTVTGGTSPYTFDWNNDGTGDNDDNEDLNNLTVGTYAVTITDANGCTTTNQTSITQPTAMVSSVEVQHTCDNLANGSINLSISGGTPTYTYDWDNDGTGDNNDPQDLNNLSAGTYHVTITDANGCTHTDQATVNPSTLMIPTASITNISCNGNTDGVIDLSISGGNAPYTYDWDNDGTGDNDDTQDLSGLGTGNYNVTITDATNCTSTYSATITEPAVLSSSLSTTNNLCYGDANGTIDLTVTGGTSPYTYDWGNDGTGDNDDPQDLNNLTAGTYSVTIIDANGCTTTNQAVITQPTAIISSLSVLHACDGENNGSVDLSVSGGTPNYTFLWSNNATTEDISGLGSGTYTVTITDANGCTHISQSVTLNQSAPIVITFNADDISCFGETDGSIDLSVTGGNIPYTYDWDNDGTGDNDDTQDLSGLSAGNYAVTVSDANNCTATGSATITEPNELVVVLDNLTHATCIGATDGFIEVTITGGTPPYTYSWNGPNGFTSNNEDIYNLAVGMYGFEVTDANGCLARPKYEIEAVGLDAELVTDAPLFNNTCCAIASLNPTNGTAPYTWVWSGNNYSGSTQDVSNLCNGDYNYTLTDASGCELTDMFNIESLPCPSYVPAELWLCGTTNTQTLMADVPNPLWSTGETTQSIVVDEPGLYFYTYDNLDGCTSCPNAFIVRGQEDFELEFQQDCQEGKNILVVAPEGFTTYTWTAEYLDQSGQPFNPSGYPTAYPANNTNNLSLNSLDINPYFDNGISTYVTLTATNDDCTFSTTILIPQVRQLGSNSGLYSEINNNIITNWYINQFGYLDFVNTPLVASEYTNSIVLIWNKVTIKQDLDFTNVTVLSDADGKFEANKPNTNIKYLNSTLKNNGCVDTWQGIEAFGQSNQPHTTTLQPTITLSGSEVRNAKIAVKSTDGAIIKTYNSKYKNNQSSIVYSAYNGGLDCNASQITNNTFEYDHNATFSLTDYIHLYRIPSMKIYGNDFSNNNYSLGIEERATAVYSSQVNNLELAYTNTFDRMTNALKVFSSINVVFERNEFTNNYQGAILTGIKNLTAHNNQFNDMGLMPTEDAFQMSVAGCTAPDIAYNSFKHGVVGLHLAKSNFDDFRIYKNTFENFDASNNGLSGYPTAFLNEAVNGTFPIFGSSVGAELKCNSFSYYDYAIAIMSGSVKREHGYDGGTDYQAPAGNQFYDDGNMSDGRFFVSTIANQGLYQYQYFRHNQDFTNPELAYTGPLNIDVENTGANFDDDLLHGSCPEESTIGGGFSMLQTELSDTKTEISTKQESLVAKVDQGNTELLLSDIAITTDATYTDLVEEVQSIDSYLSDEAAIEFMAKPTARPVAKTIALVANSPLPSKAKAKIAELEVSDELKNYILAHQNGLSKREKEEKEIHLLKRRKDQLLRQAVRLAYQEETADLRPAVLNLLQEQGDWKQKTLAYTMLVQAKQPTEAAGLMSELRQDLAQFDTDKQYQLEDYLDLLTFETEIDSLEDSLRVVKIIEQQAFLNTLKDDLNSEGSVMAEQLLKEAGLYHEVLDLHLPRPEQANRSAVNYHTVNPSPVLTAMQDILEVYPNPVDNQLTVEYIMFNGLSSKTISIYNINGQLLISQAIHKTMDMIDIDVSELSAGTYIIAFGSEGTNANAKKFIVK